MIFFATNEYMKLLVKIPLTNEYLLSNNFVRFFLLNLEINLTFKERKKIISSVVSLDSQLIFNVYLVYDLIQLGPIICQSYIY